MRPEYIYAGPALRPFRRVYRGELEELMIKEEQFRKVLGQFATGVSIATTLDEAGEPHGLTVSSFNSVSLDPPLVLWSLDRRSHQLGAFSNSGFYAISVLAQSQKHISEQFSAFVEDRFAGLEWEKSKSGAPILKDALAKFDCKVESIVDGGDHIILIGRVIDIEYQDGAPLLYHDGKYKSLGGDLAD